MKKILILFFGLLVMKGLSQDSLHVYNLQTFLIVPQPVRAIEKVTPSLVQTFTLVVTFCIDKPDSTNNVSILIGNAPDDDILSNEQIKIVKHTNIPCMHDLYSNKEICKFYNKTTKFEILLNKAALSQLNYVSINAMHRNGSFSQKKYYKIQ